MIIRSRSVFLWNCTDKNVFSYTGTYTHILLDMQKRVHALKRVTALLSNYMKRKQLSCVAGRELSHLHNFCRISFDFFFAFDAEVHSSCDKETKVLITLSVCMFNAFLLNSYDNMWLDVGNFEKIALLSETIFFHIQKFKCCIFLL